MKKNKLKLFIDRMVPLNSWEIFGSEEFFRFGQLSFIGESSTICQKAIIAFNCVETNYRLYHVLLFLEDKIRILPERYINYFLFTVHNENSIEVKEAYLSAAIVAESKFWKNL